MIVRIMLVYATCVKEIVVIMVGIHLKKVQKNLNKFCICSVKLRHVAIRINHGFDPTLHLPQELCNIAGRQAFCDAAQSVEERPLRLSTFRGFRQSFLNNLGGRACDDAES